MTFLHRVGPRLFFGGGWDDFEVEASVEAIISQHPEVSSVVVVGLPDTRFTEMRTVSNVAKEMIDEAIAEKLDIKSLTSNSNTLRIEDLGCLVGPNTFIAMQSVLDAMERKYLSQGLASKVPEFDVFFNNHATNDFNTLFASLPHDRQYFAAGVPGSFYGHLFPEFSLHFVYSSCALHWLSKLPEELLDKNSEAWNNGRIHYTSASEEVGNDFAAQFIKDMNIFLSARAKEIVAGGMIVLILPGCLDDIHYSQLSIGLSFDFIGYRLMDMVNECWHKVQVVILKRNKVHETYSASEIIKNEKYYCKKSRSRCTHELTNDVDSMRDVWMSDNEIY
ncbi:loganic acid O-methyltransferase-like [Cornus florida]|uniref:loganic acid O-methyltransferase-like n=1 Tax=Cornus florida TaxID=4283 RepID=UPI00289FBA4F|nr:loganic acid O-methyltransferase-like [Cornus florida]